MSRMKTLLLASLFSTATLTPAWAQDNMSWTFAACAGRFSAQMEHAWLMGASDSTTHENNRAAFVSLTQAVMTPATARALLNHRIEAKHAQARLIQTATFVRDERRANFAQRMAATYLRSCEKLLLRS